MEPVRTCIGCRQRDNQSTLVRVVSDEGKVVLSRTAPGRGAWLHPTAACGSRALNTKAFARALKTEVTNFDAIIDLIQLDSAESGSDQ